MIKFYSACIRHYAIRSALVEVIQINDDTVMLGGSIGEIIIEVVFYTQYYLNTALAESMFRQACDS